MCVSVFLFLKRPIKQKKIEKGGKERPGPKSHLVNLTQIQCCLLVTCVSVHSSQVWSVRGWLGKVFSFFHCVHFPKQFKQAWLWGVWNYVVTVWWSLLDTVGLSSDTQLHTWVGKIFDSHKEQESMDSTGCCFLYCMGWFQGTCPSESIVREGKPKEWCLGGTLLFLKVAQAS